MKNKFYPLIIFFAYNAAQAQVDLWPFKDWEGTVRRGNITGTVGDYRAGVGTLPVRFHAGTDFTSWYAAKDFPDKSRAVYSMHAGTVHVIKTGTCLASYVSIELTNGTIVYYKHIEPSITDPVSGVTGVKITLNTQVQVGTFLGNMILESGCAQHVHINDNNKIPAESLPGTTNYINNFVRSFHDTSPPDFMHPFNDYGHVVSESDGNDAVEFRSNGHTFSTQTNLMNQTETIHDVGRKIVYDKIDILTRSRDRKIHISGGGDSEPPYGIPERDNGINKASYQLLNNVDVPVTTEIENINFNTVPPLERALYVYDNRSVIISGASRHIYILTNKASAVGTAADPWDRFFNTRLRINQTEDWNLTNRGNKDARCNKEAQYPDGEYTLRLRVKDISNQQGTTSNVTTRDAFIVIDNFRPYVESVQVRKNSITGDLVYYGYRKWNVNTGVLNFFPETYSDIGVQDNVWIEITTSEPVQNLRVNIPSTDGTNYTLATPVPSSKKTKFVLVHGFIATTGSKIMNIQAEDLAGNPLQTDPSLIPVRQANGTWDSGVSEGADNSHYFNTGTSTCSGGDGGRVATNARTSSGCLYADFSPSKFNPAIGEAVIFTPVVAGKGVITYSWDFGPGATPATSTSSGPQTVIYSTTGTKNVSLKICDNTAACITDTQTDVINVGARPSQLTVDFSADRLGGNIGDNIRLSSSVTGATGTVSYAWDFGEGLLLGQFSDINPLISYSTPGNKTIQLRVTDANGSVTMVKNNYLIITSPAFNVNVNILSGCGLTGANGTASFSAAVSGGNGAPYDSYMWDFGDGGTSNSSGIVSHTYKKSGKYTVRITVCDETGCTTGESIDCVTVPSIVDANTLNTDFLIENILLGPTYTPIQVGLNTPVTFTDATTGGGNPNTFTYSWDFESHYNNSTGIESANPGNAFTKGPHEVYYTVVGKKEISHTAVNSTLSRRVEKKDAINVTAGLGSGRCFATMGEATISSTCWSPTNLPTFAIPVLKSNCPVVKTEVIYWVHSGEGIVLPSNKLDFVAMGIPIPEFPLTADFSFSVFQYDGISYNRIGYKRQRFTIYGPVSVSGGADLQSCLGSSVVLGTTSSDNLSYYWSSSNAGNLNLLSSVSMPTPVFTGIQKGTYTFSLNAIDNQSGCTATDQVSVVVDQPDVSNATVFAPLNVATTLTANTTGGFGSNTYAWSPGTNLSSATIDSPLFTSATEFSLNYIVTVTDQVGCSGSGQVYVNASIKPSNLQVKAESYSRISMTWSDLSQNETGFVIQRSVGDNSNYFDIATVNSNTTYFEDLNIEKTTTYYYRVAALVNSNRGTYSNEVSINTNSLPLFTVFSPPVKDMANALGDLDKDGDLDLVTGNDGGIKIYNNNNGIFALRQNVSIHNIGSNVKLVDLDDDNDLDIYYCKNNSQSDVLRVILNNQSIFTGIETSEQVIYPVIFPFDFNNDNTMDLFAGGAWAAQPPFNMRRYQRNTSNNFSSSAMDIPVGNWGNPFEIIKYRYSELIGIADMDNNGMQDIIAPYNGNIRIYPSLLNTFSATNARSIFPYSSPSPSYFDTGGIDIGDIDGNGHHDMIIAGREHFGILLNTGFGVSFMDVSNTSFPKPMAALVQLGDYDMDGDLDFFISNTSSRDSFLYRNDNTGFFNVFSKLGGDDAFYRWIDFDGDGDLDILGTTGNIYLNSNGDNKSYNNTPPSSPSNLCAQFANGKITFSWNKSSDTKTGELGLTYNIYVKQNGTFIMSPMAELTTGYHKVLKRGNVDQNTSWTLSIASGGAIEWGVQAIDNQYAGSRFATSTLEAPLPDIAMCGSYSGNETFQGHNAVAPQNCPSNLVTILPGASVTLIAKSKIHLLPGFSVQRGSTFNAKIIGGVDPLPCIPSGNRLSIKEDDVVSKKEISGSSISFYPNPSQGEINFDAIFSNLSNVTLEIVNVTGYTLLSKKYESVETINDRLDISPFAVGLYLIRIKYDKEVKIFRIVKQ